MNSLRKSDLIEAGRRLWQRELIAGGEGNLSIRLRGERILATVSGVSKGNLSPEHFVELDMDGNPVGYSRYKPSSEIKMHLAAYRLRPDIGAVCHAHPPHATAFATAGLGIDECVVPEIIVALGSVPLAKYATPSTNEVPQSISEWIGKSDAVLLENHGALTVGKDIFDALFKMESIDHAARILILARQLGGASRLSSANVDKLFETRQQLGFSNPVVPCRKE